MITQSVKMAWKSIVDNKMRSFLTMLGIIIGVFALVVLVSLVQSSTESVKDSISALGANLFAVTVKDDKGKPVRMSDLEELEDEKEIALTTPVAQSSMVIRQSGDDEESATVYGTSGSFFEIQNKSLYEGRFLKNVDIENHTMVAVISYTVLDEYYSKKDVIGQNITLDGIDYQIVGVLAEDENTMAAMMGETYDVYVPYTTLIRTSTDVSSDITTFYATSTNTESMEDAQYVLESWLNSRFDNDEDAYDIIDQSSIMEAMDSVTGTMSLLLGGIAGISLLVGGIGIMNIMLVSVTERTREIGIRKAIGASRQVIMLQFLIEAFIISLVGCLIGIGLSAIAILIVNIVADVSYTLSLQVVIVSVAFSMFVGLIFGLYPANKAAKKKPIDALRYIG